MRYSMIERPSDQGHFRAFHSDTTRLVPAFDFHGPACSIARPLNHLALDILRFARSIYADHRAQVYKNQDKNVLRFRRMGSGAC